MEKELAGEQGDFYNLKLGRGGLLEVDFIAQHFQLCHGAHRPLEVMARRLGHRRPHEHSTSEQLLADHHRQTEAIRGVYGRVLGAANL